MKIELGQVQKMLEWLKTKLYLDSIAQNACSRAIKRGQVYRCNFGCGIGSEMQKERPAVIIQNDVANSRSGNTIVIPITHDTSTLPCVANITPQTDAAGNIILEFLEKTPLNIWIARTIACVICVGVCSLLYYFLISKKEK